MTLPSGHCLFVQPANDDVGITVAMCSESREFIGADRSKRQSFTCVTAETAKLTLQIYEFCHFRADY